MSELRGLLAFFILRQAERVLPVEVLYRILQATAFVRAVLRDGFKKAPRPIILPGCFHPAGTVQPRRLPRMGLYLNRSLQSFPDRLATPKWLKRFRIGGREHLRSAQEKKRPIILAIWHAGPFPLVRYLLRAAGIPAAVLIGGDATEPSLLKRLGDRCSPFAEIPTTFSRQQLREAVEFLGTKNPLVMAVDYLSGRQMRVPVRDGWSFLMATGAIRLAIRHQAELVPCCLIEDGPWRFRIELGRPVPAEHLTDPANLVPAGQHIILEMLNHLQKHPEQCPRHLIDLFQPDKALSA